MSLRVILTEPTNVASSITNASSPDGIARLTDVTEVTWGGRVDGRNVQFGQNLFSPVHRARKLVLVFVRPGESSSLKTSLPAQRGGGGVKRASRVFYRDLCERVAWLAVIQSKTEMMYIEFLQDVLLLLREFSERGRQSVDGVVLLENGVGRVIRSLLFGICIAIADIDI